MSSDASPAGASLVFGSMDLQDTVPEQDLASLASIRKWIFEHTGLHFSERKQLVLYRRLQSLCWRLSIPNLEEMDRRLHGSESTQLAMEVACAVSTNHTFFFREPEVLSVFQKTILPQLPAKDRWRIWSAASSSGEEAYTLAILIAETIGQSLAQQKVAILGTDISYPMVNQAEHAIYTTNRMEQVPPAIVKQYFQPVGLGQMRVAPMVKQLCTFRQLNLQSAPWPFRQRFHVIFCRNVLYYFDKQHQEQLIENLYDVTEPEGWLVTSVTETMHDLHTRWHRVDSGVFRKLERA